MRVAVAMVGHARLGVRRQESALRSRDWPATASREPGSSTSISRQPPKLAAFSFPSLPRLPIRFTTAGKCHPREAKPLSSPFFREGNWRACLAPYARGELPLLPICPTLHLASASPPSDAFLLHPGRRRSMCRLASYFRPSEALYTRSGWRFDLDEWMSPYGDFGGWKEDFLYYALPCVPCDMGLAESLHCHFSTILCC